MVPQRPAVYARDAADWSALMEAAAARSWPVPVVYAAGPGAAGRLEAAVRTGRHDGLLMPLPGVLGDAWRLMRIEMVRAGEDEPAPAAPVLAQFTVRGGLVTFVDSWYEGGGLEVLG